MEFTQDEILSISKINYYIHFLLNQKLNQIWVKGELSNLTKSHAGHLYFTMKDTQSSIDCIFLKPNQPATPIEDNTQCLVRCDAQIYQPSGRLQLRVYELCPIDQGAINQSIEGLKNKLKKEGLFDYKHKKPLPRHIQSIALITSAHGDAISDVCEILKKRAPSIKIYTYNNPVQGPSASSNLIRAILHADQTKQINAIIIARGGGSLEDLMPFNNEQLVRSIFATQTVVITGIGHEADTTLCDWVADYRAPTPSFAAQLIADTTATQLNHLKTQQSTLKQLFHQHHITYQSALKQAKNTLISYQHGLINQTQQYLRSARTQLSEHTHNKINHLTQALLSQKNVLNLHSPAQKIPTRAQQAKYLKTLLIEQIKQHENRLSEKYATLLEQCKRLHAQYFLNQMQKVKVLTEALHLLSPYFILQKGYAILLDENTYHPIDVSSIKPNDSIIIQTHLHQLSVSLKSIKKCSP